MKEKRLKELLSYDPDSGIPKRVVARRYNAPSGAIVGSERLDGYLQVGLDGKQYLLHRLAFLYVEGFFPENYVDHIDRIRKNNKWSNLRLVSSFCNSQNTNLSKKNTSGIHGVSWNKRIRRWRSRMQVRGKEYDLGYYRDLLEAALSRYTAEIWCDQWTCNEQSELSESIARIWPSFNK